MKMHSQIAGGESTLHYNKKKSQEPMSSVAWFMSYGLPKIKKCLSCNTV